MDEQTIRDCTILLCRHGSHAYGLATDQSDVDEKGVCILKDPRYYIGLSRFDQKDGGWDDSADRQIYDIRKFATLALACNPNIIEVLFVDESDIISITGAGEALRSNRCAFLSRRAAKTFVGYALSQLHRVKNHKRWIDSPPVEPSRDDFVHVHMLTPGSAWRREFAEHEISVVTSESFKVMTPAIVSHFDKQAFKTANKRWADYRKWRENRNPIRAEMEEKFSFDCKHAMHLMRLLRMGLDLIKTGEVIVKRPDRDYLLAVRNGEFEYEDLLAQADAMVKEIEASVDSSPLPNDPDVSFVENLIVSLIQDTLAGKQAQDDAGEKENSDG